MSSLFAAWDHSNDEHNRCDCRSPPDLCGKPARRPNAKRLSPDGTTGSRIGSAAPQRYKSIRDANDWENPYLIIRRDGIEVMVKRLPSSRKTVAAADLARTLIGLPVTAWPYGRVVAVQEISIREADRSDENRSLTISRWHSRFSKNWM